MSTTYAELKTRVATVLHDPSNRTFTAGLVAELIAAGLIEVGRLAPEQFTEDLDVVSNQLTYAVRSADFATIAVPEIELTRVEIWDGSTAPDTFVTTVNPASFEYMTGDAGWTMWGGELTLPTRIVRWLDSTFDDGSTTYFIRIYGYSPYVLPSADADVIAVSKEVEQALVDYTRYEAIQMLLSDRDLFSQWQTRSGNTDMSPAGLMNQLNIAEQAWRRKSRAITRLRSQV